VWEGVEGEWKRGKESPMTRVGFQCSLIRVKRYSGREGVARWCVCERENKGNNLGVRERRGDNEESMIRYIGKRYGP
jgi:hypothetical protein